MKEQIHLLLQLHQIDSKIHSDQDLLEGITPQLEAIEKEIADIKGGLEEKTGLLEELEKSKRGLEREVEIAEARLKEFQGKLNQIKTNKEYQAALKEIADTRKLNKGMEDQILEMMTRGETLKKEKEGLEASLQSILTDSETKRKDLQVEAERARAEIESAERERKDLVPRIDRLALGLYERIKKVRREAMTAVQGGTCQGCFMHVPPQLTIEIQKLKTVHPCPSCHRILYLAEWLQAKPEPVSESVKEVVS